MSPLVMRYYNVQNVSSFPLGNNQKFKAMVVQDHNNLFGPHALLVVPKIRTVMHYTRIILSVAVDPGYQ